MPEAFHARFPVSILQSDPREGRFFLATSPLVSSQSWSSQNNARKTSGTQGIQGYALPKILRLQVTKGAISCILGGKVLRKMRCLRQ